ncbi:MAG: ABC transporter ATP-binding protein/permease [Clostridia bacterium]|nr:ABC transporter ATP-binding protein/permease [Clostridia bacterium]
MLPLDRLTDAARAGFAAHGITEDTIRLALQLDMDVDGRFGETWLCIDKDKMLHIISAAAKEGADSVRVTSTLVDQNLKRKHKPGKEPSVVSADTFKNCEMQSWPIVDLESPYIDNFVTSERFLAKIGGHTTVLAQSTNARKQKMFAFVDLMERLAEGREIEEDDPIFDQFNAKCPKCGKIYADQNRKICTDCVNNSAVMVRLFKYLTEYKWSIVIVLFCMLATSAISLASPLISGKFLYDGIISETGRFHNMGLPMVWFAVGLIFVTGFGSTLINILKSRINAHMSTQVTLAMKMDIFTAMQHLSLSFFNNNQTGRLITRVNYDADVIRGFFIDQIPALIIHGVNYIGLTIICLILNWKLTLIVFIPVPIIVCIFKFMLPKLWRMYSKRWRRSSSLNAMLSDSLTGIRVVKAFSKEAEETNRFYTVSHKLFDANLQLNMTSLTIFPVIGLLIGISCNAIWGFGGMDVINHRMTYGEFAAFWGYIGMIFAPLNFFTQFLATYTNAANSAQRMFEIIDAIPEITDCAEPVDMDTTMKGDIVFDKVCFHYTANRPILKDVSMHIHAGDNVGLVGHTGSGKSTIANLINRLYDVTSGKIMIDGVNVKNIKLKSLRKNIAIVSQEIFLFKGTIADNIRYAKPDATMEEVIAAAKIANAHDFILSLPDGYETIVGTGSRSLSGGEKQRVSIARAVLLAPAILILDEATAAMDTETERLIQDALTELIRGRTTITIAHRLSTLKDCNYLMAIENGEIAEEGTHTELLEKKGIYYRLYTIQTEAMKKVIAGM